MFAEMHAEPVFALARMPENMFRNYVWLTGMVDISNTEVTDVITASTLVFSSVA